MLHSWERTPSYAPTPGYHGSDGTPSVICSSPDPEEVVDDHITALDDRQPYQVGFKPLVEQESGNGLDEEHCNYIHYVIEWKVALNNRVLAKDTEQDLARPPSSYWQQIMETAESVLYRKIARNRRVRLDDTTVIVSVNDRSQRDLTKRFDNAGIDWVVVEKQLLTWAHLYCHGKKLRIHISINYIEDSDKIMSRGEKRGQSSVTKRMLEEREVRIDAEQASGQHTAWRDVYRIMRCSGPPCRHEGQYCWQDPAGKKHYKLRTIHMKTLVKYVEQGGIIETHDDIPDSLREQLYAEENQRMDKQRKVPGQSTASSMCPININVLPARSTSPPPRPWAGPELTPKISTDSIVIPGLLDTAVEEYTDWQQSRVSSQVFKDNLMKAREIALEQCLDLVQIHEDQDPDYFVRHGVKIGVARRFVRDIRQWARQHRSDDGYQ